jgi:hypothetical protein
MFQENLEIKFDCVVFLNQMVLLQRLFRVGKLGKSLIKQDHIIVVGGPGISPERNYHYLIENDFNFIAHVTSTACGKEEMAVCL